MHAETHPSDAADYLRAELELRRDVRRLHRIVDATTPVQLLGEDWPDA
jgi:hypothetical protein